MRRPAMDEFLRRYLPALRAHVVARRGVRPDQADDLLQGFVCGKLLERNLLSRVAREGGRFRTFLLTTLDRYVIDQLRAERVRRRAGDAGGDGDFGAPDPAAPDVEPSEAFDAAWARAVVAEAVWFTRAECEASGRQDLWDVFRCRVLDPATEGAEPPSHGSIAGRIGVATPAQVANLLVTAKRMFRRNLRRVVMEYALNDADGEEEMGQLLATLGRSRGAAAQDRAG